MVVAVCTTNFPLKIYPKFKFVEVFSFYPDTNNPCFCLSSPKTNDSYKIYFFKQIALKETKFLLYLYVRNYNYDQTIYIHI